MTGHTTEPDWTEATKLIDESTVTGPDRLYWDRALTVAELELLDAVLLADEDTTP